MTPKSVTDLKSLVFVVGSLLSVAAAVIQALRMQAGGRGRITGGADRLSDRRYQHVSCRIQP